MPIDIDKYVKNDNNFKLKVPKFKLPKIKFPKISKPNIKLNQNTTIILVVLILASAYIYIEKSKINYQEEIRQEKILNKKIQQRELEQCLSNAFDDYTNNWNRACKKRNLKYDCSLPSYNANTIEKWHSDAKKECMDKFKNEGFE